MKATAELHEPGRSDHGHAARPLPADGGDSHATLDEFSAAGVDVDALAAKLQETAAKSFVDAWNDLIGRVDEQCASLGTVNTAAEGVR
jgi:transaldolase